jgi:GxxExxY protein
VDRLCPEHTIHETTRSNTILYKGEALKKKYAADFICYGQIVIELKALEGIGGREVGQLLNYLKATRFNVGLLINFGSPVRLEWHRYVI